MLHKKTFLISLILLMSINIVLYFFIAQFHNQVPLEKRSLLNAHHYKEDDRYYGGEFSLLRALGNYDAQWYLRIAEAGYPDKEEILSHPWPTYMGGLTYAFFPLYPSIVHFVNIPLHNIELAGFILANLLLIVNGVSLYYVVTKLYSEKVAIKTLFLLFLFPLSIFYRSYFSEEVFLLLLIWFSYFLIRKKTIFIALSMSLLLITRPTGMFLIPLFLGYLLWNIRQKRITIVETCAAISIAILPFCFWIYFNYRQTDDPWIWRNVQAVWYKANYPLQPIVENIRTIASFARLPLHTYHQSKIDTIIFLLAFFLTIRSRNFLKKELWYITLCLVFIPLFIKDFMSYGRYQIITFPLFLYLAGTTNKYVYTILIALFTIGLCITSLYFVNWYWIG
jgi:hypothetical protein